MQNAQLSRKQRQIETLYSSVLRDRTTEQWVNFTQHANTAKQLGLTHLQDLLLIEQKKEESNLNEMRELINRSQQNNPLIHQNNPILRFFSAEANVEGGALQDGITDLNQAIQLMEPFYAERCGEISEDGSNLQYSPVYCSVYFQAQILRATLILNQVKQQDDAQVLHAVSEFEKTCDILWKNKRVFELFDALALFRVQYGMIDLAVTYHSRGEIVKAVQFLRKFFLPDAEAPIVIPVQRQAKERALLLLGSILSRCTTNHIYNTASVDAQESLIMSEESQLNGLKKLDQQHPRMLRSKSTAKQIQKSTVDTDIYLTAQNWIEEALLTLLSLERLTSPSGKYSYKLSSLGMGYHMSHDNKESTIAALYDNIIILLSEQKKYCSLLNIVERGLSRYNEDIHFWYQFALVLIKSKKYHRALKVLDEIVSIDPTDVNSHLLAVRVCLQHLPGKTHVALEHAKVAVEYQGLHAMRSYHMLGLTYAQLGKEANSRTERQAYEEKALDAYNKAYELDPNDYMLCYHMALQYGEQREIQKSFSLVKQSLSQNSKHVESWLLLVLLFTCEKNYVQALKTTKVALAEHPKNLTLTLLNARLHELVTGDIKAKRVYDRLYRNVNSYKSGESIKVISNVKQDSGSGQNMTASSLEQSGVEGLQSKLQKRSLKAAQMYLYISDALKRLDVGEDILPDALNKILEAKELLGRVIVEASMSQNESASLSTPQPNGDPNKQEDSINMYSDAFEAYVNDSQHTFTTGDSSVFKLLPKVCAELCYYEGRYREETGDETAVKKYENALVCDANHSQTMIRLGIIMYTQQQKHMAARSYLQNAVRVDPSSHEAWFHLGMVMKEMGDLQGASECLMASLKLEQTTPLIAFEHVASRKL